MDAYEEQPGDTLAALFGSREDAARAIEELSARGFTAEDIGVATRDPAVQRSLAAFPGVHEARGRVASALGAGHTEYLTDLFERAGYSESDMHAQDFYVRYERGGVLLTIKAGNRDAEQHETLSALPGDPIIIAEH